MNDIITTPGLFGQKHSSRDYTKAECWGKNQFNSSFPASLVAYMHYKGINPIYLYADKSMNIQQKEISGTDLFGIDPLSDNAFYAFEAGYSPYDQFYSGDRESIDLVMQDRAKGLPLCGLEVKLTALPDETTYRLSEDEYGCEIVVRPPTVCFLVCSICNNYKSPKERQRLLKILQTVPQIIHWEEADEVAPHYEAIEKAVVAVCKDMNKKQKPLIIQPIWKTVDRNKRLADDCLDVFVWSDIAMVRLCLESGQGLLINRLRRTVIWIYKMLFDYVAYGRFDYVRIVKNQSYGNNNDKAFSISGRKSHQYMQGPQLLHPRIGKNEIKNIILGGGQNLLSPERRFDAMIVNTPDLF